MPPTASSPLPLLPALIACLFLAVSCTASHQPPESPARPETQPLSDAWLTALRDRDLETLDVMLSIGATPDRELPDGKTALMVAAQADDERLVRHLLEAGATVDATNVTLSTSFSGPALTRRRATPMAGAR